MYTHNPFRCIIPPSNGHIHVVYPSPGACENHPKISHQIVATDVACSMLIPQISNIRSRTVSFSSNRPSYHQDEVSIFIHRAGHSSRVMGFLMRITTLLHKIST